MLAPLIDTHCHLDFQSFDEDRDAAIHRALDAGVRKIVVPAVDFRSNSTVVRLAEQYDGIFAAVGIHPNEIPQDRSVEYVMDALRELALHPKVIAVGEIGLDYHWKKSPPGTQLEWLNHQLQLASEISRPVILHNRKSGPDLIAAIEQWVRGPAPTGLQERFGVLHSFSENWNFARKALNMGFYLGIAGPITFKKADELRNAVSNAPADRLIVETDAPFLPPYPHRGERNEPAFIRFTLEKLAEIREISVEDAARMTTENAERLFGRLDHSRYNP